MNLGNKIIKCRHEKLSCCSSWHLKRVNWMRDSVKRLLDWHPFLNSI